jgi:hypothetical protein
MTTSMDSLYAPITDASPADLENFSPEDFNPCLGSILVVIPPPKDMEGSIHLPQIAQQPASVGRVVAVPPDAECPVSPGDWAFFRVGAGVNMSFEKREDLVLLQYCEGPASEIIGYVRPESI